MFGEHCLRSTVNSLYICVGGTTVCQEIFYILENYMSCLQGVYLSSDKRRNAIPYSPKRILMLT